MKKTRILIADDHTIVRIGLSALLNTQEDLEIVGEAGNGNEAVSEALRLNPDIVIMDLMMPKKDGVAAARELKASNPKIKVIILTSFGTSDAIAHALETGVEGAVTKTADDSALISIVRKIADGGRYVSPQIRKVLQESPPIPELTVRQHDIIQSLARGLSNTDIAKQFGIAPTVAREHITIILNKLGASNRTEAVAIALRKHLLKI